jgi:Domain of unknown function (DUF6883)
MSEVIPHPARVPGAEEAIAPDNKFRDYLLNPEHPIGAAKARFFLELGWGRERWQELRDLLLAQLPLVEGRFSRENEYNGAADYEAVIEIPRDTGDMVAIGTYWQVHPEYPTKFLTAYPL